MAWPLTPLTTYIANSVPAIKAADLNGIQSAINQLYTGQNTIAKLAIDGMGNNGSILNNDDAQLFITKSAEGIYKPLIIAAVSTGSTRFVVDHNGYISDQNIVKYSTDFIQQTGLLNADGYVPGADPLFFKLYGGAGTGSVLGFTANYNSSALELKPGTVNGDYSSAFVFNFCKPKNATLAVLEWDMYLSHVGTNSVDICCGLFDATDPTATVSRAFFRKQSTDTNWQVYSGSSGGVTTSDTGVAPTVGVPQKFRIELLGDIANSVKTALFFINNQLVYDANGGFLFDYGTLLNMAFWSRNSAGVGSTRTISIGAIRGMYNRDINSPYI
jgi:hypothetical protein